MKCCCQSVQPIMTSTVKYNLTSHDVFTKTATNVKKLVSEIKDTNDNITNYKIH